MLQRQRHARRPDAAHADPGKRAEREEHRVRSRKAAEEGKQRVPKNRKNQRTLAAPAVRGGARADAARDAKEQRDGTERAGQLRVDGETLPDVGKEARDDREIESVERPAEVTRRERPPLFARDFLVPGPASRALVGERGGGIHRGSILRRFQVPGSRFPVRWRTS